MSLRRKVVGVLNTPWMTPVSLPLARMYGGLSTSLMYHRVHAGPASPDRTKNSHFHPNLILAVAEDRFEQQMRWLRERSKPVRFEDAVSALAKGRLERGSVSVTFDDGYRDNLKVALPILERYEIPATIYITTGLIDRTMILWWEELEHVLKSSARIEFQWKDHHYAYVLDSDSARWPAFWEIAGLFKHATLEERAQLIGLLRPQAPTRYSYDSDVLTWDEVRELDRHPLITLGAHTLHHSALIHSGPDAARAEMVDSRKQLEEKLGHAVTHFAYPFGGRAEAGERDFGICAAAGFESAVTTRPGHWHASHRKAMHALPRIMVEYFDTAEDFRFKLSGLDAFLQQKGRRFVTA